jgi:hypothetical protein
MLDDWQQWYLTELLSERSDGRWSAFEAALLVARQNGKNAILEALELAAIYIFEERLIIHSAHLLGTATEHFLRMQTLIEGTPELLARVAKNGFVTANGKEAIKFKTGQRIKFLARSKSSGRGLVGDRIVLDESQSLFASSLGSMLPTMATKKYGQVIYTGSAPLKDSEVSHGLIARARSGQEKRLLMAGWINEPGIDPLDREAWRRANPTLGNRIEYEFLESMQRALISAPVEFAREHLSIPEEPEGQAAVAALVGWGALVDSEYEMSGRASLGLEMADDGSVTVLACQTDREGMHHVEIIAQTEGSLHIVGALTVLRSKTLAISIDMTSPAVALVPSLKAALLKVVEVGATDAARASMAFEQAVDSQTLRHRGDPRLTASMLSAQKEDSGKLWRWKRSTGSPALIAASLAMFAAQSKPASKPTLVVT